MSLAIRILWASFGLLQFLLAAAVAGPAPWLAALFALGGVSLLVAVARRSGPALAVGVACSLIGPLAVGLTGIEAFAWAHHAVRLAIVGLMVLAWLRWVRPASGAAA